jgi:hypothetical protein
LVGDFADYARGELAALEPGCADADVDPFVLFFDACESLIPSRRRVVYAPKDFNSPSDLQLGFEFLLEQVRCGACLRPHQTMKLLSPAFEDLLLDWGIHPFHLGIEMQSNGFVERTERLLFARVTDFSFFVLGVFEEGAWTREGLVRTIHESWPDSIDRFRVLGIPANEPSSAEPERRQRGGGDSAGVVAMPDGTVYHALEVMPKAEGTSTRAMACADAMRERLRWWEQDLRSNVADLRDEFPAIFAGGVQEVRLRGEVCRSDLYVVHEPSATRIWVGQLFA